VATSESNRRNTSLKIPALPFRGVAQKYPKWKMLKLYLCEEKIQNRWWFLKRELLQKDYP